MNPFVKDQIHIELWWDSISCCPCFFFPPSNDFCFEGLTRVYSCGLDFSYMIETSSRGSRKSKYEFIMELK